MSNIPITNLPLAIFLTGGESIPAVQGDATVRVTAQQIADLFVGGGTVTEIVAGKGLSGGTITQTGTIALETSPGAVGTYAFLSGAVDVSFTVGQTFAGSGLTYSGISNGLNGAGVSPSGIWQAMGTVAAIPGNTAATLFVRIA